MEIWLDVREAKNEIGFNDFDRIITAIKPTNNSEIHFDGKQFIDAKGKTMQHVVIDSQQQQDYALSLVGIIDWILVSAKDWAMIPFENIVAACQPTHTKIAAFISDPEQAIGAAFALESGVNALIVPPDSSVVNASLIAKSLRLERSSDEPESLIDTTRQSLSSFIIKSIDYGNIGDRICIDLTSFLTLGEGALVGSSAMMLAMVHAETIPSEFVPTRPFRINAGAPHSYILMADDSMKYLSELSSGDNIAIFSTDGVRRSCTIGRLKIEQRPFLKINFHDTNNNEGHIFLQQAETVRLVSDKGTGCSVTHVRAGDKILGLSSTKGTHIGHQVSGSVEEK